MEYWPLERRKIEAGARSRKDLDGKVAVVIGAATGIGRATALRFAAEGAHVLLADMSAAAASKLADEINGRSPQRALARALDAGDPATVADVMGVAVLHFGGIDVLFYSPGVAPELHTVADMPDAEVERQMRVHYQGAVAATREAARGDAGAGDGRPSHLQRLEGGIRAGRRRRQPTARPRRRWCTTCATSRTSSAATGSRRTTSTPTPSTRRSSARIVRQRSEQRGETEEETLARYAERSVLREALVPPEAVAEAALWLASDRSAYTTGCVITVGGGAEGFPR